LVRYIAESEDELDEFLTIQEPFPTAYLTLIVEGRMSHSFPLRGEVQLGREKGNAIVVADQKVSRRHAILTPIDNSFIIIDQGSANGTYINGVLIAQPTRLKNNDKVSVGDTTFLFTTNPPEPDSVDRPLPSFSSPPPARPIATRLAPTTIVGNNTSIWILVGCMVLIIIALLFIVAVLLGLFIGHNQLVGWVNVTQSLI
jgi:pSer/pThr/pTyr-binding forkhead associated (FHA) protein